MVRVRFAEALADTSRKIETSPASVAVALEEALFAAHEHMTSESYKTAAR
jgi:hypothetical protein